MVKRLTFLASVVSFLCCCPVQRLLAPPTAVPLAPRPGRWTAAAESLGALVFEVAPDSTSVTLLSVHFKQFECASSGMNERWLHGDWMPDTGNTGVISGGRFTLGPGISGPYTLTFGGSQPAVAFLDHITIRGTFDADGTRASGTWEAAWAGAVCSGAWEAPPGPAPAPPSAATPRAPERSGAGFVDAFDDAFDDDANGWFVGDYRDRFVIGKRTIVDGVYRWQAQALQPSRFSSVPQIDPVSDFHLMVDARRVSGDVGSLYGLLFRRLDRNNFYLFQISDEQGFCLELLSQDEWTTLIDWTETPAVRPGEVNRLAVRATGSHFELFVNDAFVGQADDDEFHSGTAGLVIGFPEAGDSAVFEFDNFELGP